MKKDDKFCLYYKKMNINNKKCIYCENNNYLLKIDDVTL